MSLAKITIGRLLLAATLTIGAASSAQAQTGNDGFKPVGELSEFININRSPTGKQLTVSARFIVDEAKTGGFLQVRRRSRRVGTSTRRPNLKEWARRSGQKSSSTRRTAFA